MARNYQAQRLNGSLCRKPLLASSERQDSAVSLSDAVTLIIDCNDLFPSSLLSKNLDDRRKLQLCRLLSPSREASDGVFTLTISTGVDAGAFRFCIGKDNVDRISLSNYWCSTPSLNRIRYVLKTAFCMANKQTKM